MAERQIVFLVILLTTLGIFAWSMRRLQQFFRLTRPHPVHQFGKRLKVMLEVGFAQTKILRWPFSGILHALVFWGFLVITIGSLEMVVDGVLGLERSFAAMGVVYDIVFASGEIFALLIILAVVVFMARRLTKATRRLWGYELKRKSNLDARIALVLIFLLMISLLGMNLGYLVLEGDAARGSFPVSSQLAAAIDPGQAHLVHEVNWWSHILLIFLFANILPYSKHFHVFTSIPNVYLSSLKPQGYLANMEDVAREVRLMMDPSDQAAGNTGSALSRFGVKDVEDVSWKNYLDSLACTECGRCTAVCPANQTGKKLSPRKIFVDLRSRMKQKGPGLVRQGMDYQDGEALLGSLVTPEELWACTTCCACAMECPVNINHPALIVDMRRYLVMEEASAPAGLNAMFANIENNGAPWQYPQADRLNWTRT